MLFHFLILLILSKPVGRINRVDLSKIKDRGFSIFYYPLIDETVLIFIVLRGLHSRESVY